MNQNIPNSRCYVYALAGVTGCINNWPSMSVTKQYVCVCVCIGVVISSMFMPSYTHTKSLNTCNLLCISFFLKPLRDLIVSIALHIWFLFFCFLWFGVRFVLTYQWFAFIFCCRYCCCCFWLFANLFWLPKWPQCSLILFIHI